MTNGEMTNGDVIRLHMGLKEVGDFGGNRKFSYAVARNLDACERVLRVLDKMREMSSEMRDFEKARLKLVDKYAQRDSSNRPKQTEDGHTILKDREGFEREIGELRETHKEAIAEHEAKLEAYGDLLDEPAGDVRLYKTDLEKVPKEVKPIQLARILKIIKEPEDGAEEPAKAEG